MSTLSQDDTKALGVTTEVGGADHDRILEVMRQYTIVVLRSGRIKESHQDAMIHGETEHSRWVEHHAGYQDHGPIAHAPDRRATGRKRIQKHKKKAKAALRRRPAALPDEADAAPTITVTLCGAGKDNELARLSLPIGVTAHEFREIASRILGQSPKELVLMNLDEPMYGPSRRAQW